MAGDGIPEGLIAGDEVAELASLFDGYEFAFDPLTRAAREAESEFEERVRWLFAERVQPRYASIPFAAFRCKIKSLCRVYLRRNAP